MSTKVATQEMCSVIVNSLSWIDNEAETECIKKLKLYREQLIQLPNTIVEGEWPVAYPEDPRSNGCSDCSQ